MVENKWVKCSGMGVKKCPVKEEANATNHDEIKVLFTNRYVIGLHWCLSFPWSQHHGKNSYIIWSSVLMHSDQKEMK